MSLSDEAYEAGLRALEETIRTEGEKRLIGAEYCLVEVNVTHAVEKPAE